MNIDIDFRSTNPQAKMLSNLYPHKFTFRGVKCGSMEGLLQSLKRKDVPIQIATCAKAGFDAKFSARGITWQNTGLWWAGVELDRFSDDYALFIHEAYTNLYEQNMTFREALEKTSPHNLDHSIGRAAQKDTILTKKEFCSTLLYLRSNSLLDSLDFER